MGKALPKLKNADRLPDASTVRRWSSGLDFFQLALSFIHQTTTRLAPSGATGTVAAASVRKNPLTHHPCLGSPALFAYAVLRRRKKRCGRRR